LDIKEEVSIKVEEAIDMKDELLFLGHLLIQYGNCEITLNISLLCVILWVPYTDGNLDYNHDEKRLFGSHSC